MQPSIHGYVIGATNALFKAKRDLSDVLIDVDEDCVMIKDNDLKRAISLTTEDLRFIDNIIRYLPLQIQRFALCYHQGRLIFQSHY